MHVLKRHALREHLLIYLLLIFPNLLLLLQILISCLFLILYLLNFFLLLLVFLIDKVELFLYGGLFSLVLHVKPFGFFLLVEELLLKFDLHLLEVSLELEHLGGVFVVDLTLKTLSYGFQLLILIITCFSPFKK